MIRSSRLSEPSGMRTSGSIISIPGKFNGERSISHDRRQCLKCIVTEDKLARNNEEIFRLKKIIGERNKEISELKEFLSRYKEFIENTKSIANLSYHSTPVPSPRTTLEDSKLWKFQFN